MLGSEKEYHFWFITYVRYLVQEGASLYLFKFINLDLLWRLSISTMYSEVDHYCGVCTVKLYQLFPEVRSQKLILFCDVFNFSFSGIEARLRDICSELLGPSFR